MTATELAQRTAEATTPEQVAQLVADFKAHKDEQLSDLTNQVNDANRKVDEAEARASAADKKLAELQVALETAQV